MTGWQVIGVCIIAIPVTIALLAMGTSDPEACCLMVLIVGSVALIAALGSALISGWTP